MSDETMRAVWMRLWGEVSKDAIDSKNTEVAPFFLFNAYRELDASERPVIDRLIADQLSSPDSAIRFDALALIAEFSVVSAVPELHRLAVRLEAASGPEARFEHRDVLEEIGRLTENLPPNPNSDGD